MDEITPPHALMAGKILFRSGAQGVWDIDRTGRINWDATLGEPTADDLREFETELQSVIRRENSRHPCGNGTEQQPGTSAMLR